MRLKLVLNTHFAHMLFEKLNDLFLVDTIKQFTRQRGSDNPSALDWILTEDSNNMQNVELGPPLGSSDHMFISCELTCETEVPQPPTPRLAYNKGNYDKMREDLSLDWEHELNGLNTQETWDRISSRVHGLIERYIPKKTYAHINRPPWLTRKVKKILMRKTSSVVNIS